MPLIKSISGMRGTLGGTAGKSLTPIDVVDLTAAFGTWCLKQPGHKAVVIGRDARPTGPLISQLVSSTLQSVGLNVIDVGLSTTPTVALAISDSQALGGIMITASHNPIEWNALKLFNATGELLDTVAAAQVFDLAAQADHVFAPLAALGSYLPHQGAIDQHIAQILALPLVDAPAIRKRPFRVAIDAVNSTGALAVPQLLQALGVNDCTQLFCTPNGEFPHNPEPLPEHLHTLTTVMQTGKYDLGLAVDPDVDRLVILDEKGVPWGEEYTLVAVADYVLQHTPGNTASNLSSSNALKDITTRYGGQHYSAPVGEAHVVAKMKATQAVIGGEGNGGIIYPPLHYGRDALVGIALLLSYLARTGQTASALRASYPDYVMVKKKVSLASQGNFNVLLDSLQEQYKGCPMNTEDGLKITLEHGWVHLRQSNTEPIVRIYAEAPAYPQAQRLADQFVRALNPAAG